MLWIARGFLFFLFNKFILSAYIYMRACGILKYEKSFECNYILWISRNLRYYTISVRLYKTLYFCCCICWNSFVNILRKGNGSPKFKICILFIFTDRTCSKMQVEVMRSIFFSCMFSCHEFIFEIKPCMMIVSFIEIYVLFAIKSEVLHIW